MKKIAQACGGLLAIFLLTIPAYAYGLTATPELLISGLMTGQKSPDGDTSDEFVSMYNNTQNTIDLKQYRLEYLSANGSSWSGFTLSGSLAGGQIGDFATANNKKSPQPVGALHFHLAEVGGHVRIVTVAHPDTMIDLVGWGSAAKSLGAPAAKPGDGNVLRRKITNGTFINSNNNAQDFIVETLVTPAPTPTPNPTPAPSPIPNPVPTPVQPPLPNAQNVSIRITELLPNPAVPQTDANDEYIELYNEGSEPVVLDGYKLQTGTNFTKSFTIKKGTIAPGAFAVFYSRQTKLMLSNSGGHARVVSADGRTISETPPYATATAGAAWALVDGTWAWTTMPTAGSQNVLVQPITKTTTPFGKSAPKSTAKTAKKGTVSKPKAKSSSVLAAKTTEPSSVAPIVTPKTTLHPMVFAVIALGAVGYAAYEYRTDLTNKLQQLRVHRTGRRTHR